MFCLYFDVILSFFSRRSNPPTVPLTLIYCLLLICSIGEIFCGRRGLLSGKYVIKALLSWINTLVKEWVSSRVESPLPLSHMSQLPLPDAIIT